MSEWKKLSLQYVFSCELILILLFYSIEQFHDENYVLVKISWFFVWMKLSRTEFFWVDTWVQNPGVARKSFRKQIINFPKPIETKNAEICNENKKNQRDAFWPSFYLQIDCPAAQPFRLTLQDHLLLFVIKSNYFSLGFRETFVRAGFFCVEHKKIN